MSRVERLISEIDGSPGLTANELAQRLSLSAGWVVCELVTQESHGKVERDSSGRWFLKNREIPSHVAEHEPAPNAEAPIVTSEYATQIEKLRRKLLDLTGRNRLLNFKHPKARSVTFVNTDPAAIVGCLAEGKAVRPDWVEKPTRHDLERRYPEWLDENPNRGLPKARDWAGRIGIERSPDLRRFVGSNQGIGRGRHGIRLQTLFYPEELETRFNYISRLARTAIEDSGFNILYLAYGFLEWRDREDADPMLAPLVLVPVSIRPGEYHHATRRRQYSIIHTNEETQINISLREKLARDHGLDLPEFSEDETAAHYLDRCAKMAAAKQDWRVIHRLTLGFFNFSKLLLWMDLDPKRWPENHRFDDNPIVRQYFEGGEEEEEESSFSPVADIDRIPVDSPETKLIWPADSSQHSAIIDIAKGRNTVIEGPPGTGKSQTITNVIGVALLQGKRVLFMSEKMAALEVVWSRLEKASLAEYCLDLHSHNSKKREIIQQLARRIEHRPNRLDAHKYQTLISRFINSRDKLNTYVKHLRYQVPEFDYTVHELLWEVARDRSVVEELDSDLPRALPRDTVADRENRQRAVQALEQVLTTRKDVCRGERQLSGHPLYGISAFIRDPGWQAVSRELTGLKHIASTLHAIAVELPAGGEQLLGAIRKASGIFDGLDGSEPVWDAIPDLPNLMRDPERVEELADVYELEKAYRRSRDSAEEYWASELLVNNAESDRLLRAGDRLRAWLTNPEILSSETARAVAHKSETLRQLLPDAREVAEKVTECTQISFSADSASLAALDRVLDAISMASHIDLEERSPILEAINEPKDLEFVAQQQEDLEIRRARLAMRFDLQRVTSLLELESAKSILAEKGGILSRFDPDVTGANQLFKSIYRGATWRAFRRRRIAELGELIRFLRDCEAFESSRDHQRLLGKHFRGLETPTRRYLQIVQWQASLRHIVAEYWNGDINNWSRLARLPSQAVEELQAVIDSGGQINVRQALHHILEIEELTQLGLGQDWMGSWSEAVRRIADLDEDFNELAVCSAQWTQDPSAPLEPCLQTIREYQRLAEDKRRIILRNRLIPEREVRAVLDATLLGNLPVVLACSKRLHSCDMQEVKRWISSWPVETVRNSLKSLLRSRSIFEDLNDKLEQAKNSIGLTKEFFSGSPAGIIPADFLQHCDRALAAEAEWPEWRDFVLATLTDGSPTSYWESLKQGILDGSIPDDAARALIRLSFHEAAIDALISKAPGLEAASREYLELRRQEFQDYDDELLQLHQLEIAAEQHKRPVPPGTRGRRVADLTERALLEREISKQRRHVPVRRLLKRAGRAIQGLKPCFMMSPLSVAQYIEPGGLSFDLLIMDEASQIRPEDALGAIARSKQVVVVGDPKQLPPTNFFQGIDQEDIGDPDEETIGTDNESILDALTPTFACRRSLNWHYRSRHESLIAFSNRQFYDERLIVFPGPGRHVDGRRLGVDFHYLDDGSYQGQCNAAEASAVVRYVLREIRQSHGRRSIGVVAVNIKQADLIAEEWDRMAREHREIIEPFKERAELRGEPLFFKNLENVQGDERDVVVISLTYGPDGNGHMFQRFGPINQANGWRRLNVLFTRARENMVVFSSMKSVDVRPSPGNRSVTALKDFLAYCESGGRIPDRGRPTHEHPDSPFEEDVISLLTKHGYEVEPQVGVAGYRIDIGVKHPEFETEYVLGIECDGMTYHAAPSARDRDKLRQEILEGLGWKIHRIWSVDWYRHRDQESRRLLKAVAQALQRTQDKGKDKQVSDVVSQPSFALEGQNAELSQSDIETGDLPLALRRQAPRAGEPERDSDTVFAQEGESADDSHVSDSAIGGLDHAALERKLLQLRSTIEQEFPEVPRERSLLRDELIHLFVQRKPTSRPEFARMLPMADRQRIDSEQAKNYLETVLSLCEEYA